ncbi:MAG: conserved rane protein of unknown function [Acidimicrobiales bacterium]|nr:conserved rane protein of unknown function [Acidimicrobiales bacterium]
MPEDAPDATPKPEPETGDGHEPRPRGDVLGRTVGAVEGAVGDFVGASTHQVQDAARALVPAWKRATEGETRWPVGAAVAVAIYLQLRLPRQLAFRPIWLLPTIEAALLIGLLIANPRRINRHSRNVRIATLALIALASLGNAWSAGHLIRALLTGHAGTDAGPLLADGGAIWLTNVIVFALWYWELDRGGPASRAQGTRIYPDFQFPQMGNPELAPHWEPNFWDYFYVSFTNATAFSPTDAMPLTRWTKMTMLVQSAVSLSTVALVIARAVNILK